MVIKPGNNENIIFILLSHALKAQEQETEIYLILPDTINFSDNQNYISEAFEIKRINLDNDIYGFYFSKHIPQEIVKCTVSVDDSGEVNLIYFGEPRPNQHKDFTIITKLLKKM